MKRRKMNDSENIKMNLNIGGQRIVQTVPFRNQDFVRDVEKEVDNLYSKWRKEFHSKTDREILAMVAYRVASFYWQRSLTTAPDFSIQHLVSIFFIPSAPTGPDPCCHAFITRA